jgi:predicted O-methyltransferase YrrM
VARERPAVTGALAAHLDGLVAPDAGIAPLYARGAADPAAAMMTHPELGRLLAALVTATGGRRVLEIGTYLGVSATWMARALAPGGHLDTLEADAARAAAARAWFDEAGLAGAVAVHEGPAAATLPALPDGAYDLCYLDADKPGYPAYLDHAVRLLRPGGLLVADNLLLGGRVADPPGRRDAGADAVVRFSRALMDNPHLRATVLGTGDGVGVAVRLGG